MTNILTTWDSRENCGEVKFVWLDPNPPLLCGHWPKNKNTNRLAVNIKLEKSPIHQHEYL